MKTDTLLADADTLREHGADIDQWSDARLAAAASEVLARPKIAAANSFILHAPLELLARYGLLRHVDAERWAEARQRIAWLAATYSEGGDEMPSPKPAAAASPAEAATLMSTAIKDGDLDAVDAATAAFAALASSEDVRPLLADAVLPYLSAAAHASIALHLFPRVSGWNEVSLGVLRGTARELTRYPMARLEWAPNLAPASGPDRSAALGAALARTPNTGPIENNFIWPTMAHAESSGVLDEVIAGPLAGPVDLNVATRELTRVAAQSMLQDDSDHAPYGWSHCLTMPQAVLSVAPHTADPRVAVAVAATYVAGFRTTLGATEIDLDRVPAPVDLSMTEAIAAGPSAAAAVAWHARGPDRDLVVAELASRASAHEDAHLVKYTLACFDAAAADPPATRLYLAAAAHLNGWWVRAAADS